MNEPFGAFPAEASSFIVFDLEWNQCPYGKDLENKDLPFEIIDIGAVKLNAQREIVDTFHAFVRPTVYRSLHFRTRKVIGIERRELESGRLFPEAASDFLAWCGENYIFCTFGDQDLYELQRNLKFYGMLDLLPGPRLFLDVQKLFAISFESRQKRRSLEYAAEFLGIEDDPNYHRALVDAQYTAQVFIRIPIRCVYKDYSIDCYQPPRRREDELLLYYDDYQKYISRVFPNKAAAIKDEDVTKIHCIVCGRNVKRMIRWTAKGSRTKQYYTIGTCGQHGCMYARIRIKYVDDEQVYIEKVTRPIGEEEVRELLT